MKKLTAAVTLATNPLDIPAIFSHPAKILPPNLPDKLPFTLQAQTEIPTKIPPAVRRFRLASSHVTPLLASLIYKLFRVH